MKFLRITFRCFGPFEEQTLDLSGPSGLRIIFGENEAGKSSALRGMMGFLFGFPGQSTDDFRYKYNQFRINALLENADASQLECIRRKGNKDTLRKICDKEVISERQLTEFIGGLDENQFEQLFGLDAERLRQGGEDIVRGTGELGEALFAAGAGMKGLRNLSQELEKRQQELYLSGGRKQLITEGLREYRELEKQIKDLLLSPDEYAHEVDADDAARAEVAALVQERKTLRAQSALFNRYRAALPTIDLLRTARERLALVADAPLLSTDFNTKLEKTREKLATATIEITNLEADHRKLTELLENEQPSAAILNEENEIGELKKHVGADVKSREEEVKAATFSVDEQGKARDIYRELTGSTDWDQMGGLKPRLDERNRINKLANERSAIVEEVDRLEKAVREAGRLLARAKGTRTASPVLTDPSPWQDAVDEVVIAGKLEDEFEKLTKTVQAEERRLADEFARFNPTPPAIWQNAPAQPVPLSESAEVFRQEFDNARAKVAKTAEEKRDIEGKIAAIRGSLIDKVGSEPVPTADELTAARRDRDGGLHCIRLRLSNRADEQIEGDFTRRHAPGRSLIDAAEKSVHNCDTFADRLRHEADRIATFQSLQQQLKSMQERLAKLDEDARDAMETLAEVEKRWQATWLASRISPDAPKVMQAWLISWTMFGERVISWESNRRQCEVLSKRIDALSARLSDACPAARNAKTLVERLALAKRAIAEATKARAEADNLDAEVIRLQTALETVESDLTKAKIRREEWEQQWAEAVAVLRLKDVSPSIETAQAYLNRIDQMQHHLRDMRLKDARVKEIKTERGRLIDRMNALRLRVGSTARSTSAESIDADFREVESALGEAMVRRTRHLDFSKQLNEVDKKLGQTGRNLSEAKTALEALASEARVEANEIPVAVQRARERAEAASHMRQYEEALAQNAAGEPTEAFIAAALTHRSDLHSQLDELGRRVEYLDSEVSLAEAAALETGRTLEGYRQSSSNAAEAQQNAVLRAARIKDQVIEYAALHMARTALDKAKERYRARNQDTLLDLAGAYFQKLTDGAFSGIDIENEDGSDVLKAVRATNNRPDFRVPVAGLSDGTRDQLFLALRLAGIEHHLKDREPVPLIIDDVLINFDDDRARATLNCLAELAKRTQVIVFTHHKHVVDLACGADSSAIVHKLAPNR